MNCRNEISFEERKEIQIEMLKEIHEFCASHKIRYSLAYGTLIGAIRHQGFIPWDDDVDIMMPLPDMLRFKREFRSNKVKYCDVDTEEHYDFAFSRVVYSSTYNKIGIFSNSYGINIDLYVVISISVSYEDEQEFFCKGRKLLNKRLTYMKWRGHLMKFLPIQTIPGFDLSIRKYRDHMLFKCESYGASNHYFVVGGSLSPTEIKKCTYNYDLFQEIVKVNFEGLKLNSIARYHDFLTHYYGDYMVLPPEDQRHPYHGGHYYWK